MAERIADLTLEDISSDGSGTADDLDTFKRAAYAYRQHHGCSEQEAIEAIYGDGDFWTLVKAWLQFTDEDKD